MISYALLSRVNMRKYQMTYISKVYSIVGVNHTKMHYALLLNPTSTVVVQSWVLSMFLYSFVKFSDPLGKVPVKYETSRQATGIL